MSIYMEHRVCAEVNRLESELPWFWFLWNRRFYMQKIAIEIVRQEIEIKEREGE